MRKSILLVIAIGVSCLVQAQKGVRQRSPVYTPGTAYKNNGWCIAAGMTYMLPVHRTQSLTIYTSDELGADTLYNGDYKRAGKIGAYLEFGRHHFIQDRFLLHHVDYGVHGKLLRGKEQFSSDPEGVESNSKYSELFVGAFGNASHIMTLKDKNYLMNSLGVNLDFRVLSRRTLGTNYGATYAYPDFFTGQLHYKLSYIWRPESGIYVIPSIETPLITVYPWDNTKSTLQYFTDRSRPFIISLRIQWLSKQANRKCEGQPGQGPSLDKGGRHSKNDLFGEDAKSMKKSKIKTSKRQQRAEKKGKRKADKKD